MSKEAIELLRILREETQSRDVLARCDAEIERLNSTKPYIGIDYARPNSDRSIFYEWFVDCRTHTKSVPMKNARVK